MVLDPSPPPLVACNVWVRNIKRSEYIYEKIFLSFKRALPRCDSWVCDSAGVCVIFDMNRTEKCVAVCCSVLQCVAVCCRPLKRCDMTRWCVVSVHSDNWYVYVTCLILSCVCDTTHDVWRDFRIPRCANSPLNTCVSIDRCLHVTWLMDVWHDSLICICDAPHWCVFVTWLMMCDVTLGTKSRLFATEYMCGYSLMCSCDITHWYVYLWHGSWCVTWLHGTTLHIFATEDKRYFSKKKKYEDSRYFSKLMCTCEMTHWRVYSTLLIDMCHDSLMCDVTYCNVPCLIHMWHDSRAPHCVCWPLKTTQSCWFCRANLLMSPLPRRYGAITHLCVLYDSFIWDMTQLCVTWLMYMCQAKLLMSSSINQVWSHDSFVWEMTRIWCLTHSCAWMCYTWYDSWWICVCEFVREYVCVSVSVSMCV